MFRICWFLAGAVVVVEALPRRLHSLPFEVSRCFYSPSAAAGARGGAFFTCLFWALCHSLLSHPNYIISTVAKVGICRRSSAASSAMFTAVWSFFWRLLKKIHWSIPFATPVTRLPDHNKNPEGLASLMEVSRKPVSMPCNAVTGNKD